MVVYNRGMPFIDTADEISDDFKHAKGCYALFLDLVRKNEIEFPHFGLLSFPVGLYVHVGSA